MTPAVTTHRAPAQIPTAPGRPGRRRRHILLWSAVAVATLIGVAATDAAVGVTTEQVTSLAPTGLTTRIEVDIAVGPVTVSAGEAARVEVATRRSRLGRIPTTDLAHHDGVLRVTGSCPAFSFGRCQTPVTVVAPAGTEVAVRTTTGLIRASGVTGGLDLRAHAGAIVVRDVAGMVRLRTEGGAIEGTVVGGDIHAVTSAGLINLTVTRDAGRVSAVTSAGSVDLTVPDDIYRVDARTALGRTEVDVRTDATATRSIEARSEVGRVRVLAAPPQG